jgi:hypothetical protein
MAKYLILLDFDRRSAVEHKWQRLKLVCKQPFGSQDEPIGLARVRVSITEHNDGLSFPFTTPQRAQLCRRGTRSQSLLVLEVS